MNLYKLHDTPESLHRHKEADKEVPKIFWPVYAESKEELEKREDAIIKDPIIASRYAKIHLKKPWPKAEATIATNAEASFSYARHVLKGPFPKGEETISKNPFYACSYAMHVLKGPFKKAEKVMAQYGHESYEYALTIDEPFIAGEKAIVNDGYAKSYVDKFPERKEVIINLIRERP